MAEQRKVNTSPLVKSLANMDQEIKAILEDTAMPPDRKIQLYDSIMNRYRSILNHYRTKIPYMRVLKTPKRKKRKRVKRPAFATPIGIAVLSTPVPVEEEEKDEEAPLLLPLPPAETPLQLPTPPEATPFKPPYHGKEKKGKEGFAKSCDDPFKTETTTEGNQITAHNASSLLVKLLGGQHYKFSASSPLIISCAGRSEREHHESSTVCVKAR